MGFVDRLKNEWTVIRGAFWSVLALLVLTIGGTWAATGALYGERIATLEARVQLKDDQIATLKAQADTLPGLLERVKALEDRLLTSALESAPPTMGKVVYGSKWAQLVNKASAEELAKTGWDFDLANPPDYQALLDTGPVFQPSSAEYYTILKSAFESTGLPFLEKTTPDGENVIVWDVTRPGSLALP
jgi:hypothetical protein